MNLSSSDKDKFLRIGVISAAVIIVAGSAYWQLHTPDVPSPPAAPVIVSAPTKTSAAASTGLPTSPGVIPKADQVPGAAGVGATKGGTTASQYDPTLKMEAMLVTESLHYSGTGRNIFSGSSTQPLPPIPQSKFPPRPPGPQPPTYFPPPVAAGPPPIDLKFFGTETLGDGTKQAFLLHGDDVFLAATGSIVQRRYKIGTISASSVQVEDLTNNNTQSLSLTKN